MVYCSLCVSPDSPITVVCKSDLGDTKICAWCLEQIKNAHGRGRLEQYSSGRLIPAYYKEEDGFPPLWIRALKSTASDHWWSQVNWWRFLSKESREGMAYALDQRPWPSDEDFLYARWTTVARFFNHHPRPYWVEDGL